MTMYTPSTTRRRKSYQCGFTLVEMIVSLGLFTVLMLSITGALLSMMDANRKAGAVRSSMDGVNFALDDMSRNIRTGWNYTCITTEDISGPPSQSTALDTSSCPTSPITGGGIKIETSAGTMEYYFRPPVGTTFGVINKGFRDKAGLVSYAAVPLTPEDVNVTSAVFYVLGNNQVGDGLSTDQPRVFISMTGTSGWKQNLRSTFQLQTLSTSRIPGGQP